MVAGDCVGKSHLSWKGIEDGLTFVAYAGLPGKIPLLAKVQVAGLCVFSWLRQFGIGSLSVRVEGASGLP